MTVRIAPSVTDASAKPARSWLQNALIGGGLALLGTITVWVVLWKVIR